MSNIDQLIKAWDEAMWEFSLVFEGLSDEDLWKRAHPKLLSVGELAGHVAYWDAVWSGGQGSNPDLSKLPIQSPLVNPAFRYYTTSADAPAGLDMGVEQVKTELKRVQEATKANIANIQVGEEDPLPGQEGWTLGAFLRYRIFHAAYHAGQAYSVRHLLGHTTTDN